MKELYNRMNEHINPSTEVMNAALDALEGRSPFRRLAPTLAVLLVLLLVTPALAFVPPLNDLLYQIAPEVAMCFRPINRSDTDQGITVSVIAVDMEENSAVMYIAVQGEGVNETTMLYDNYYFRDVQCIFRTTTPKRYNPETQTAIFRVLYAQGHGTLTDGEKAVFTLNRILLKRHTWIEKVPELTVSDEPVETLDVEKSFLEAQEAMSEEIVTTVLKPGSLNIPLSEGITVTAAGLVDGKYHIQIRRDAPENQDDLLLVLMPPVWEQYRDMPPMTSLSGEAGEEADDPWIRTDTIYPDSDEYWLHRGWSYDGYTTFLGEDGVQYTDYVYSRPMERLRDCALYFQLTETDQVVDGKWVITFPMEDYQQTEP